MKTLANAQSSRIVKGLVQQTPIRRASCMGDARFISFISLQAALPQRAEVVVHALEGEIKKGYRLDTVLSGILQTAKATLRQFPGRTVAH